jgi:hypothetical protein
MKFRGSLQSLSAAGLYRLRSPLASPVWVSISSGGTSGIRIPQSELDPVRPVKQRVMVAPQVQPIFHPRRPGSYSR